jgi:hypothetical protein
MKKCPECGTENSFWRVHCSKCQHALKPTPEERATKPADVDDGFDAMGFAIGVATGVPLSPTRGLSVGALLGAALHSDGSHAKPADDPAPAPTPEPAYSEPSRVPDAAPSYSEPSRVPDAEPSYSAPEPSYSAPEPSTSFDSGSSGGGGGGGGD